MLVKTVKTRLNKDDKVRTETKVTIDFAGVTEEQMQELACATVIINEQAIWRTSGKIPALSTIKVSEQLSRPRGSFQATPESLAARASKMDVNDVEALVKQLEAAIKARKQ